MTDVEIPPTATDAIEAPEMPPESMEEPSASDSPETGVEDPTDDSSDAQKARKEAKGLRSRLKDAESQLETAQSQLQAMQRAKATELAGDLLASGEDLFTAGTELSDLIASDGTVDPERVRDAAKAVLSERPHWRRDNRPVTRTRTPTEIGSRGRGSAPHASDWSKLIGGRG